MQTEDNWQYMHRQVKTSSDINEFKQRVNDERSFMQIK